MPSNLRAVNRAVRSGDGVLTPAHEPLIELTRTLARQMDNSGPEPSTRLSAAYLSALKDFNRALDVKRSGAVPVPVDEVAAFRKKHGVG